MKWVTDAKPVVFLFTSGSRSGVSRERVKASHRLAARLGATPGPVFGEHLDRDVYGWVMAGAATPFLTLSSRLADAFAAAQIGMVTTDSWQHYNVVHDLWHLTVRIAAAEAGRRTRRRITCLDYPVVPHTDDLLVPGPEQLRLELSPTEVEDKLRLSRAFPEVAEDVAEVLRIGGPASLRVEALHSVRPVDELRPAPARKPLYERFGEERVAAGTYRTVLRWSHVEPIYESLRARLIELEQTQ